MTSRLLTPQQAAASGAGALSECVQDGAASPGVSRDWWSPRWPGEQQVAQGPLEGTGRLCTISWTSQSAEPYEEKAFESWSQMQSSREGSRTAGLCPRRDEEFRGKVGKHIPCVPKGLL